MELLTLIIGVMSSFVFGYCIYLVSHDRPTKREQESYDAQKTLGI